MARLSIRLAGEGDARAMARVHTTSVRTLCRSHYRAHELARWIHQGPGLYEGLVRTATVMVAEAGGTMIGFAAASLATGYVRAVYVMPGHAGGGVGRRLLARIERAARAYGLRRLVVDASLNAEAFYMRAGYRAVGRRRTSLGLGCIRMVKVLQVARARGLGRVDSGLRPRLR